MAKAPDPIDVEVGAKIKARRRLLGMSQDTLAARLGVTFQQIQKYEKGSNRVSVPKLIQICKVLGCAPATFIEPHLDAQSITGGPLLARLTAAEGKLAKIRNLAA